MASIAIILQTQWVEVHSEVALPYQSAPTVKYVHTWESKNKM